MTIFNFIIEYLGFPFAVLIIYLLNRWRKNYSKKRKIISNTLQGKRSDQSFYDSLKDIKQQTTSFSTHWGDNLLGKIWGKERWHINNFNRALTIAFVYPIAILVFFWLLGFDGKLGQVILLADNNQLRFVILLYVIFLVILLSLWKKGIFQRLSKKILPKIFHKKSDLLIAVFFVAFLYYISILFLASVEVNDDPGVLLVAGAFAVVFAVAFAVAVAGAVSIIMLFILLLISIFLLTVNSAKAILWLIALFVFYLGFLILAPVWTTWIAEIKANAWQIDQPSFVLLFFLSILPFINALSDFWSVNITRTLLAGHRKKEKEMIVGIYKWWFLIVFDLVVAIFLAAMLFALIFAVLFLMQSVGWSVDAREIWLGFVDQPLANNNLWLLGLLVTNLIPTTVHLLYAMSASIYHYRIKNDIDNWLELLKPTEKNTWQGLAKSQADLASKVLMGHWGIEIVQLMLIVGAVIFVVLQVSNWI